MRRILALGAALWLVAALASAQFEGVAGTLHNLSTSGPGDIRSLTETEVCKFCHVPHNAEEPVPLWGHALSQAQYSVPQLRAGRATAESAPQPDGSSRLCLSCHDGTVALGDIAGEARPIPMAGGQRLGSGRPGYLGTDLSGSHPISFVVRDLDADVLDADSDMGFRPLGSIQSDPQVRLDAAGKMQCTTCHDPHSDSFYQEGRVPHFWVKATVSEVCLTCHVPR